MIVHTPGEMSVIAHADGFNVVPAGQPHIIEVDGNANLLRTAHTTPHECSDPQCPGDVNRRNLAAFDGLLAACNTIAAGPINDPRIELTGEYQTGLYCGFEDRGGGDAYEGCDYGFEQGVERTLEWAQGVVEEAIANAKQQTAPAEAARERPCQAGH